MAGAEKLFVVLVILAAVTPTYSLGTNGFTNRGKKFYLGFAHNAEGDEPPRVIVTVNDYTANIRIYIPGLGYIKYFTVEKHHTQQLELPVEARFREEGAGNVGVLIESDADIGVVGVNRILRSNDAFLALPRDMLGSEYYAVTWKYSSFIYLVGAENQTSCKFIFPDRPDFKPPSSSLYKAGSTLEVTVNELETYQLMQEYPLDFTGTHIVCEKPVVVYSGNKMSKVEGKPNRYRDSSDHLVEQLTPVGQWGKEFTMIHSRRRMSSTLRIIAGHADTTVTFGGNKSTAHLSKPGDFYELNKEEDREIYLISSDKPIQAVVFDKSASKEVLEKIDPSMTVLIPNNNFLNNITVVAVDDRKMDAKYVVYMLVITDVGSVDSMLINNKFVSRDGWEPVTGSDTLVAKYIDMGRDEYYMDNTNESATFMVYVFGNEAYESYAYPAGISAQYRQVCELRPNLKDGDGLDNDCDGQVDEEQRNSKDDDNDGLVDEDTGIAIITCEDYTCHPRAKCVNGTCKCVPPYIGEGRFECILPGAMCGCTAYGDPHVETFREEKLELPLRCSYQVVDITLPECTVQVTMQSRSYTDNPLLSMLDRVIWRYGVPDGQFLEGYAIKNEVFFSTGEKVPYNRDYMLGKVLVKFLVDEAGFYTISSTCGLMVRYRDPVVSIRMPRPLVDVSNVVSNSLCGDCRLKYTTPPAGAVIGLKAIRVNGDTSTELNRTCNALGNVAASCSEARLNDVMVTCAPLMNATMSYKECGKSTEAIHKAIFECANTICQSGQTSSAQDAVNDFTKGCYKLS